MSTTLNDSNLSGVRSIPKSRTSPFFMTTFAAELQPPIVFFPETRIPHMLSTPPTTWLTSPDFPSTIDLPPLTSTELLLTTANFESPRFIISSFFTFESSSA